MSRPRSPQRGFTLVEAIVGMAILTMASLAMAGTFLVAYKAVTKEAGVISADTAISHASITLTRDLNSAAAIPTGTIAFGSTLTLTYGSPSVTVVYSITANNDLIRTAGGTARVAARGMTSVVISAAGCYATLTLQPSATGAAAATLNLSNRIAGCF
ncbi:MAG TPA: prepilin-type N-terminal cleavage/methylation domain-containing protein [Candidatus Dormibacteraeota bacterium]|nr:prepilin-type N-terminal cleavage/methylation domain-containing protein [Candidatus Dormibacteraeota bacterium]